MSRIVELQSYPDPMRAEVDRSILQDAGLFCALENAVTVQQDWMLSGAVGGVRLMIRADDWAKARAILQLSEPVVREDRTEKEKLAEKAVAFVFVGLFLGPLQYYAFWLILRAQTLPGVLRSEIKRKYGFAVALNLVFMALVTGVILLALLS